MWAAIADLAVMLQLAMWAAAADIAVLLPLAMRAAAADLAMMLQLAMWAMLPRFSVSSRLWPPSWLLLLDGCCGAMLSRAHALRK
eukprot:5923947-Karenia_brevis.AAC.1